MKKKTKITKEMTISEVIKKYPKSVFVFIDYGLHCVGCPMASGESSETIEEAAKLHRIDLKKFLRDLNKVIPHQNPKGEQVPHGVSKFGAGQVKK
jgi:hybrid cluster-associated redox disulfide protein